MTSYKYLLDTNIISYLVKDPRGIIAQKIAQVSPDTICTSIIVACELNFGIQKKGLSTLKQQLKLILQEIPILSLPLAIDETYGLIRATLEKQGTPIGPMDLLIAAHALNLNLTLVTHNIREFSRVPDLSLENWLMDDLF